MSNDELTVYYPGGAVYRFFGRLVKHGKVRREKNSRYAVAIENLESAVVGKDVLSPGSISLLDPRCVIVGARAGVIYTPRPHMHDFPRELQEWLQDNPDWPRRLERESARAFAT